MHWADGIRLKVRRGWDRVDARLVDSRFVEWKTVSSQSNPVTYEIFEYMVDVPGPAGGPPARLTFREKTIKVRGRPEPGAVVPVLVNAGRTKAMFDLRDPRIDGEGWRDRQAREQAQRDDARWEARRAGREPPPEDAADDLR